jgi:Restriction endonuclease
MSKSYSYDDIKELDAKLHKINYATTTRKFHAENQRSLMTPELRKQIKKRDKYMCQRCGKVMRDGVGLHIDHIRPVSKGGKTIPVNLQVLCSKCNGRKSNKVSYKIVLN